MSKKNEKEEYLAKQEEFCELYNIDFKKVKNLNSTIIFLIENGLGKPALLAIKDAYADINQNMDYWLNIWHLSNNPETKQNPQQKSLLDLFLYMLLVEGISSKLVQLITFILMEHDHDIYDPEKRKFVESYEDLKRISLFIKMQFIEKHGFNLLSDAVDRELRNFIAHIDLIVNEDGTIVNKRTEATIRDLEQKTNDLGGVIAIILNVINYSLERIDAIEK